MSLKLFQYILVVLFSLLLLRCSQTDTNKQGDNEKKPLARVGEEYLYKKEIDKLVTEDMTVQDSTEVVENYIDNWVRKRLILQIAQKKLAKEDKKEIQQKIKDFRESLMTYRYEKQLVADELDTTVRNKELREYYRNNQENFELTSDIVKVRFVKVMANAPNVKEARQWMQQNSKDARSRLESFCYQYAEQFTLKDTSWYKLAEIAKWLPLNHEALKTRAEEGAYLETEDRKYLYWLRIDKLISKNTTAPFSFVKDKIKKVVLNKRKVNLIQQKHNEIYAKGQENKNFEIY